MQGLQYLIAIIKRENEKEYLDFFHRQGINSVVSVFCNGTATESTLSLLGLENTEKVMLKLLVREEGLVELKTALVMEMGIANQGNGVAVFVPLDSVGGSSSLKYFVGENPIEKKGEEDMSLEMSKNVLIITIVDKGNTELVMTAAREAGAKGGTVVKAKGTGAEMASLFGAPISEEKEMVYIVAKRESRDGIMKAIMEKAGGNTDAHGVIFTLPVDSVLGINTL